MADSDDWITWAQAAVIVGCPVPTIDWHSRQGRIERRAFRGSRPSLSRESVEVFALWWTAEQNRREQRREQPPPPRRRRRSQAKIGPGAVTNDEAPPDGWLTALGAADVIGMSNGHVAWLVRHGQLLGIKLGKQIWVEPTSAQQFVSERSRWVSYQGAAELAGCSTATIANAVERGEINSRKLGRAYPSLEQGSVTAWAVRRRNQAAVDEAQRRAREYERQLASRPDMEHDWMTEEEVGEMLGASRVRINQLAKVERLPHTTVGHRHWFRRDHIELVRAARAMARKRYLD